MIGWFAKYVIFPLIPFIIGFLIRLAYAKGSFSMDLLNPPELSFSISIISLFLIMSASRIDNKQLRDAISYIFFGSLVIAIVMFAITLFLQIDINYCLNAIYIKTQSYCSTGTPLLITENSDRITFFNDVLKFFRWIILILTCIVIPSSIICKYKYDLEDL